MKFKPKHYLLLSLIFLAPVLVNYIVLTELCFDYNIAGGPKDWISFYGSFAGSVISGLITLFVLTSTLKSNKDQNDSQRDIQIKTIKYTQQQAWLENLRKQLINNYMICDMQSFSIAITSIKAGLYAEANTLLLSLIRNIEFQGNASSFYFLHDNPSVEENAYNECLNDILIPYGCLINDIIFIIELMKIKDRITPDEIIEYSKKELAFMSLNTKLRKQLSEYYINGHSIMSKIASLDNKKEFYPNIDRLIDETLNLSTKIHQKKHDLITCTEKLLRHENEKINRIIG